MNREYIYLDGKVVVKDEKGVYTETDYYDNLEEVLIQQNLIETMEKKLKLLIDESNKYKHLSEKQVFPYSLIICALATFIGAPLMLSWIADESFFNSTITTIFGPMNKAMLIGTIFSVVCLPLHIFSLIESRITYENSLRIRDGIKREVDYLEHQLETEKRKLVDLQNVKKRDEENTEFRVVKIDDLQRLKAFRDSLLFHYDLGYNARKYNKYYQRGQLEKELKKYYSSDQIDIAKEYIEEQGPTLVKKNKKSFK